MKLLPVEQRDTRFWHAANAGLRQAVLRGATRPFADNIVVNEFPKSGGSWLSQMLSEALDLPFPRHRLPMMRSCILQTHTLSPWNIRKAVVIWRDGRDVMVSLYHHLLIGHQKTAPERVAAFRRFFAIEDPSDVAGNLPRFLSRQLTDPVFPRFSWPEFVRVWHGRPGVVEVKYEQLLSDPVATLARIATGLGRKSPPDDRLAEIAEKFSFAAQAGRAAGQEAPGNFLRKGVAGDWVNHFTPEAEEIFRKAAGSAMKALGYGTDGSSDEKAMTI